MLATTQFDSAIKDVTKRRGADYGHPLDDFRITNQLKRAVRQCPDPEIRHTLEMIGVKMARLCTNPEHIDTIIDIAGYARCIAMIIDERKKRNAHESPGRCATAFGAPDQYDLTFEIGTATWTAPMEEK